MPQHFAGHLMAKIAAWAREDRAKIAANDAIILTGHQSNGAFGIHQAALRLTGDPVLYRIIIAPADAPLEVNGRPIGDHFAAPLGGQ